LNSGQENKNKHYCQQRFSAMLAKGINISNKSLSTVVRADLILLNICCIFIISNSTRLQLWSDETQNISKAESRSTLCVIPSFPATEINSGANG
jgi:hypothetical protein